MAKVFADVSGLSVIATGCMLWYSWGPGVSLPAPILSADLLASLFYLGMVPYIWSKVSQNDLWNEWATYKIFLHAGVSLLILYISLVFILDREWILSSLLGEWLCVHILGYFNAAWVQNIQLRAPWELVNEPVLGILRFAMGGSHWTSSTWGLLLWARPIRPIVVLCSGLTFSFEGARWLGSLDDPPRCICELWDLGCLTRISFLLIVGWTRPRVVYWHLGWVLGIDAEHCLASSRWWRVQCFIDRAWSILLLVIEVWLCLTSRHDTGSILVTSQAMGALCKLQDLLVWLLDLSIQWSVLVEVLPCRRMLLHLLWLWVWRLVDLAKVTSHINLLLINVMFFYKVEWGITFNQHVGWITVRLFVGLLSIHSLYLLDWIGIWLRMSVQGLSWSKIAATVVGLKSFTTVVDGFVVSRVRVAIVQLPWSHFWFIQELLSKSYFPAMRVTGSQIGRGWRHIPLLLILGLGSVQEVLVLGEYLACAMGWGGAISIGSWVKVDLFLVLLGFWHGLSVGLQGWQFVGLLDLAQIGDVLSRFYRVF